MKNVFILMCNLKEFEYLLCLRNLKINGLRNNFGKKKYVFIIFFIDITKFIFLVNDSIYFYINILIQNIFMNSKRVVIDYKL